MYIVVKTPLTSGFPYNYSSSFASYISTQTIEYWALPTSSSLSIVPFKSTSPAFPRKSSSSARSCSNSRLLASPIGLSSNKRSIDSSGMLDVSGRNTKTNATLKTIREAKKK